jgi:hypothetical protein
VFTDALALLDLAFATAHKGLLEAALGRGEISQLSKNLVYMIPSYIFLSRTSLFVGRFNSMALFARGWI